MFQVEEGVIEELLEAQPLLGIRLEAAGEEVPARPRQLPAAGDDDGLPLLDLDQHLDGDRCKEVSPAPTVCTYMANKAG